MLRLLYVFVLINLAYGCWRRNDGDDSNNSTVGNASSTAAPLATVKPGDTSINLARNMSTIKNSTGKATSSSIRSQLGLELFGLSLAVVCFLF
ncbi:hypothetical protein SprV_0802629000 [Sparganum proliferum]